MLLSRLDILAGQRGFTVREVRWRGGGIEKRVVGIDFSDACVRASRDSQKRSRKRYSESVRGSRKILDGILLRTRQEKEGRELRGARGDLRACKSIPLLSSSNLSSESIGRRHDSRGMGIQGCAKEKRINFFV